MKDLILSFGESGFTGLSQVWHQILTRLAGEYSVLHVTPFFDLRGEGCSLIKRVKRSGLHPVNANLYEYQPNWYLPKNYRSKNLNNWVQSVCASKISRIYQRAGYAKPIVYIWHPHHAEFASKFDAKLVCYHIYDDYASFPSAEEMHTRLWHDQLVQKADLVFTTSPLLYNSVLSKRSHGVYLVPNGGDFDLFSAAAQSKKDLPEDLSVIPNPRIGYTGNINSKLDFQLLFDLARNQPKWSFVLIGPVNTESSLQEEIRLLSNIHLLGQKPYSEVPRYVAGMDCCLIPYKLSDWVLSGYPQKIHEYLAAGKPVVCCDMESMRPFSNVISIAKTTPEWQDSIQKALEEDCTHLAEKRKFVASQNSWDSRASQIESYLYQALLEKD